LPEAPARWLRKAVVHVQDSVARARYGRSACATTLSDVPGLAPGQGCGRLCLFAHFDPQGTVDPYVQCHLASLRAAGFDVVFVTTSPEFGRAASEDAARHTVRVVHRQNVGLDFGSWKAGLGDSGPVGVRQVVLANDSVYGPFRGIERELSTMGRRFDLWGFTSSVERGFHVQSYFLVFEEPALAYLATFLEQVEYHTDKQSIIDLYEVGASSGARRAGLRVGAVVHPDALRRALEARGRLPNSAPYALNPSLFAWDVLIEEFGFPFLKTQLLRRDRFAALAVERWPQLVGRLGGGYDPDLVARHLERLAKAPGGPG
jgi:lipopolysaccharide biosynthesis protein